MGSKLTNAQAPDPADFSRGVAAAFGDSPEEEARKRKLQEDEAAQAQAQQTQQQASGQEPSAWDTIKSLGSQAAEGYKDVATNPGSVWNAITGNDDAPSNNKKKK